MNDLNLKHKSNLSESGVPHGELFDCAMCEAVLPEAVEGLLTASEQAAVDRHVAGCAECAAAMAEAQRGLAWLTMLKAQPPEPPAALLENILAQTIGRDPEPALAMAGVVNTLPAPVAEPEPQPTGWFGTLRRWRGVWAAPNTQGFRGVQPRLAMTTAMAFVSITLTLNTMGVSLRSVGDFKLSDLRPATVHRLAAEAGASLVRGVQGNPVVYRLESRVGELSDFTDDVRDANQPQQ